MSHCPMLPPPGPEQQRLIERLHRAWRRAAQTANLAIGVGDYEAYVEHVRLNHPGRTPMTHAEWFRARQDARYARGTSRCC